MAVPCFVVSGPIAAQEQAPAVQAAPIPPPIISREMWHAKPPIAEMRPQRVIGIILHHTGIRKNTAVTLERKMLALQAFSQSAGAVSKTHVKPVWPDVPYHFYVDAGGRIAAGRDIRFAGDTNTKYDTSGYIQVVVEGDFETETPSPAQMEALCDLLVWLLLRWNIPNTAISVHLDHAATDCPGKNFMAALPALRLEIAKRRLQFTERLCESGKLAVPAECTTESPSPIDGDQGTR